MKMCHIMKILLFSLTLSLAVSQDCKSAAECYLKAIAQLNQDRTEMRRQMDIYQNLYNSLLEENKKLTSRLDESEKSCNQRVANLESLVNKKAEDVKLYSDRSYTMITYKNLISSSTLSTNMSIVSLVDLIPKTAKKILINVGYFSGYGYSSSETLSVHTKLNGQFNSRVLNIYHYKQDAIDTNSAMFELDLDGVDWNLYYNSNKAYSDIHFAFSIDLLGWK